VHLIHKGDEPIVVVVPLLDTHTHFFIPGHQPMRFAPTEISAISLRRGETVAYTAGSLLRIACALRKLGLRKPIGGWHET
jgi:hypothetical protein